MNDRRRLLQLSRQSKQWRWICLIMALMALMTLTVYGQVRQHAFIDFDDYEYITENPHVRTGLTLDNIVWAFSSYHSNNWHPLTWLSHMVDVELFGLNPAGHHLVNVFLHIANSLLLLAILRRLTGAAGPSAFTAALFALHPLHVESVAWAAERKDVLSCLFWLLTMAMYCRYVERPGWKRYLAAATVFAMGLMAKQMLVTLPFVLLLLDYWPLGRWRPRARKTAGGMTGQLPEDGGSLSSPGRLVSEKIPLFILAAVAGVIVFTVQLKSGVLYNLPEFPLTVRIENALVAYVVYLGQTFWPVDLAVFYPHPLHTLPPWKVAGAAGLLTAISAAVLWTGKRRPYLAVGWCWYLGTLIPVIGLVQVGVQAMADRYTYIPLIGVFIMIAWGGRELITRISGFLSPVKPPGTIAVGLAVAALLVLSILTWRQVGHWRDNVTLYEHAARVVPDNYWAYNNLGAALAAREQLDAAASLFAKSLGILPSYPGANRNMAVLLYKKGRYAEALPFLTTALKVQPRNPDLHFTRGAVLLKMDRRAEAAAAFREALSLRPGDPDAAAGLQEASSPPPPPR